MHEQIYFSERITLVSKWIELVQKFKTENNVIWDKIYSSKLSAVFAVSYNSL